MTPDIPDGWYHSGNKRAKHVHYFRKGKAACGWVCHPGIPVDVPLPVGSFYTKCPDCMGLPQSRERLIKQSCAIRGIPITEFDGFTSYKPYCEKFNEKFKERVRSFFGYCCILCGEPQKRRRLHVHHVNYEKNACCDETITPLFAPLCTSCHIRTNYNREYWEDHLSEIINGYYEGKCYFTEEEMHQYSGVD